jgi:spore photoproduct lyase
MSPQRWIDRYENNTASLSQRLEAAARCEQMGFWVSFHFDPMIYHPDWEREYRDLVRRIFATIHDPADIAWWSMGGFRTMPSLKKTLQHTNTHLPLFSGEMIMGEDHKLRYFRSIRRDFYRAVRQEVDACYPLTTLYMCMESPEVWQDAGMARRIPRGLIHYLDTRAGEMLQTRKKNGKNTEQ